MEHWKYFWQHLDQSDTDEWHEIGEVPFCVFFNEIGDLQIKMTQNGNNEEKLKIKGIVEKFQMLSNDGPQRQFQLQLVRHQR